MKEEKKLVTEDVFDEQSQWESLNMRYKKFQNATRR